MVADARLVGVAVRRSHFTRAARACLENGTLDGTRLMID
jgi:hypothetical protein